MKEMFLKTLGWFTGLAGGILVLGCTLFIVVVLLNGPLEYFLTEVVSEMVRNIHCKLF